MAENINANKQSYLQSDRTVGLNQYLDNRKKADANKLDGIEIRQRAKSLGKNDFLRLLAKQLSHQDPTKPMKDTQFIAQMAQFSALEQMSNISQSMTKMGNYQAVNLVGKTVIGRDFNSNQQITGLTKAVFFDQQGTPFLRTTGGIIRFDDVLSIIETPQPTNPMPAFSGPTKPSAQPTSPNILAPQDQPGQERNGSESGSAQAAGLGQTNGQQQAKGLAAPTDTQAEQNPSSAAMNAIGTANTAPSTAEMERASQANQPNQPVSEQGRSLPGLRGKFRPVANINSQPATMTTTVSEALNQAQEAVEPGEAQIEKTKKNPTGP